MHVAHGLNRSKAVLRIGPGNRLVASGGVLIDEFEKVICSL